MTEGLRESVFKSISFKKRQTKVKERARVVFRLFFVLDWRQ